MKIDFWPEHNHIMGVEHYCVDDGCFVFRRRLANGNLFNFSYYPINRTIVRNVEEIDEPEEVDDPDQKKNESSTKIAVQIASI